MTIFDTYLKARAATEGRTLPRAALCHRYLHPRPMVVVIYKLAGDPASPLGVMYGTDHAQPTTLVAPEPRNRDIRFGLVNHFMNDLLAYVASHAGAADDTLAPEGAPQLVVPNVATVHFLEILGRSLRRPGRHNLVPPDTVQAARHLTWLAEQGDHPGQTLVLPATETLTEHWVTGQSTFEDQMLGAVLAWIDPPEDLTALQAARLAETTPTAGPASDPQWDKHVLDPLITAFNEARGGAADPATVARLGRPIFDVIAEALSPAWEDTWRGVRLLRTLPQAEHAAIRRQRDVRVWTNWRQRADEEELRLSDRLSDHAAVRLLADREADTPLVEAQETADDPLRFAALEVEGQGLRGQVVHAEPERQIIPPGKKQRARRPLIRIALDHDQTRFRAGDTLWWTERLGKVKIVVLEADRRSVTVEVTTGMGRGRERPPLPDQVGRTVRLTALEPTRGPIKPLHDEYEVWTHRPTEPDPGVNDADSDGISNDGDNVTGADASPPPTA